MEQIFFIELENFSLDFHFTETSLSLSIHLMHSCRIKVFI